MKIIEGGSIGLNAEIKTMPMSRDQKLEKYYEEVDAQNNKINALKSVY